MQPAERLTGLGDDLVLVRLVGRVARDAERVTFERRGEEIRIDAKADATVLLLSGEPIEEPIVGYGPFVMNSREEIEQAIRDLQSGTFVRPAA